MKGPFISLLKYDTGLFQKVNLDDSTPWISFPIELDVHVLPESGGLKFFHAFRLRNECMDNVDTRTLNCYRSGMFWSFQMLQGSNLN